MKTISLFSTNGQFKVDMKVDLFDNSDRFTIMDFVGRSDAEVKAGINLQEVENDIEAVAAFAVANNLLMDIIDNAGAVGNIVNKVASVTALAITTSGAMTGGNDGVWYSQPVVAEGGNGPLTFSLTGGTLPSGCTLDPASGYISGTPDTIANNTGIQITVTDAFGQTDVQTGLSINIAA